MIERGRKNLVIMAKGRIRNQLRCRFWNGQRILVDTNVWLMHYYPPSDKGEPQGYEWKYTAGLKRMLEQGVQLMSNSIIIGEYLNAYCRIEWRAWRAQQISRQHTSYKNYRDMDVSVPVRKDAASYARDILRSTEYIDSAISRDAVADLLTRFNHRASDFNDLILLETCRSRKWALYSDDADFAQYRYDIDIITSNPRMWRNPTK